MKYVSLVCAIVFSCVSADAAVITATSTSYTYTYDSFNDVGSTTHTFATDFSISGGTWQRTSEGAGASLRSFVGQGTTGTFTPPSSSIPSSNYWSITIAVPTFAISGTINYTMNNFANTNYRMAIGMSNNNGTVTRIEALAGNNSSTSVSRTNISLSPAPAMSNDQGSIAGLSTVTIYGWVERTGTGQADPGKNAFQFFRQSGTGTPFSVTINSASGPVSMANAPLAGYSSAQVTGTSTNAALTLSPSNGWAPAQVDVADTNKGYVQISASGNSSKHLSVLLDVELTGSSTLANVISLLNTGTGYTVTDVSGAPVSPTWRTQLGDSDDNEASTNDWDILVDFSPFAVNNPVYFSYDFSSLDGVLVDRVAAVPEPTATLLLPGAIAGLLGRRRRRAIRLQVNL